RDQRDAHEPLRVVAAVLGEPVVVDVKARPLQLRVLQPEQPERQRRVEHLAVHTVGILVLHPRRGVPATGERVAVTFARLAEGLALITLLPRRAEADCYRVRREALIEEEVLHAV